MQSRRSVQERATVHAALSDPLRLAVVDELVVSDRSPVELRALVGIESNLLAHHLDVLDDAGLIERSRSSGDGRRRYVHLLGSALADLAPGPVTDPAPALFVCSANSARSQLAAALWRSLTGADADSAGTHPAESVHPGAVDAAERAGLDLSQAEPRALEPADEHRPLVITVCDRAHEELAGAGAWWHWSVPDPVPVGTTAAFDATVRELRTRIESVIGTERQAS